MTHLLSRHLALSLVSESSPGLSESRTRLGDNDHARVGK